MTDPEPGLGFNTRVARLGHGVQELGGARPTAVPIHNAASFSYESQAALDAAFDGGYVYSRFTNPTVAAFEAAVAELEGAEAAVAFSSGMAAIHAAIVACLPGPDEPVAASRDCYGGTQGLLVGPLASLGIRSFFADFTASDGVESIFAERPRVLLLETISNPLLRLVDVSAVAEVAHARDALVIVDSTFSTPYLCRPLELGADLVLHSATKYIGGHGDVTAGVVAGRRDLVGRVRAVARLAGGVLGPNEAYLALRGMKTLGLRMERQCRNALELARWLEGQARVTRVYYPGLPSHPQHELATRLLRGGYGAVVSFDLDPPESAAVQAVIDRLELFTSAPTVGDLESLVMYPTRASHRGLTPEQRQEVGIGPGLIRLSVGIENVEDLRADLERALTRV